MNQVNHMYGQPSCVLVRDTSGPENPAVERLVHGCGCSCMLINLFRILEIENDDHTCGDCKHGDGESRNR